MRVFAVILSIGLCQICFAGGGSGVRPAPPQRESPPPPPCFDKEWALAYRRARSCSLQEPRSDGKVGVRCSIDDGVFLTTWVHPSALGKSKNSQALKGDLVDYYESSVICKELRSVESSYETKPGVGR